MGLKRATDTVGGPGDLACQDDRVGGSPPGLVGDKGTRTMEQWLRPCTPTWTTRSLDSWLDSRRKHVERNVARRQAGTYTGTFLTVDVDAWTAEFLHHHAAVVDHFDGRDDLLVMNITEGDGYEVLCPFLGVDPPDTPFPTRHRAWIP